MSKVEFNYKGNNTIVLCQGDEKIEDICKRYALKILIDINNVYFLYGGNQMNLQLTYNQIINNADRQREMMSVLVYDIDDTIVPNDNKIIKPDFPVCVECKESVLLELKNYKINLLGCKNDHINNISINEYDINRSIDLSKIECKNKFEGD